MLFCEREAFIIQENDQSACDIDEHVKAGLNGDEDALDRLWSIVKTVILERTTRQAMLERPKVSISKIQEWASLPEAVYRL